VGKANPESRPDCVRALEGGLEHFARNDITVNSFLISYLADLKAAEAAPTVERAYQADSACSGFAVYSWCRSSVS
jgi:hypothetical protein